IFVERVDRDIGDATSAERFIRAAAVPVAEIEYNGVADRVAGLDNDAFDVHPAVEEIGIDEVGIERVLLGVLPERLELHVVFGFQLPHPSADLIGVTLVAGFRMTRGSRSIVCLEVDGEIAEDTERDFANLESEFRGNLQDDEAI